VRSNRAGTLRVPFNHVARSYVRMVETNTIFHLTPGSRSLTFGMYGCDLHCPYCQNHAISQALRDGAAEQRVQPRTADSLVTEAVALGCSALCAAYNEPMISVEWVRSVFEAARAHGLRTAIVSDGHSTAEAVRYIAGVTDVFRVDLKAASEAGYKRLGGRLQPVLDSIALARELGLWVEVVTLVVPGLNQDAASLTRIGGQLRDIDPNMPWHLNGLVPKYKMSSAAGSDPFFLMMQAGAAYLAGSRFVYVGNVPACAELAHTRCPGCHDVVVRRRNYATIQMTLSSGDCPKCGYAIPGLWLRRLHDA
jgi:pyruvate formate lyase activating enzyme